MVRERWWIEDSWEQDGEMRTILVYRSGWDYFEYIARIEGDRYRILERVNNSAQTSAEMLSKYDLCDVIKDSQIVMME